MNPEESKPTEGMQEEKKESAKQNSIWSSQKSRPVTVYLAVMFVVALLLLLMSFFMQQRNHQVLEDLNESMSKNETRAELQMDNQRLTYELNELQEEKEELSQQVDELTKQAQALEWLRQIEAAVRVSYGDARELVDAFNESGLEKYLPTESVVEGADSPADTYRNIYAMIY